MGSNPGSVKFFFFFTFFFFFFFEYIESVFGYAPNFEKVDGAYCFWSVRAWVGAWVGASHFLYLL